MQLNILPKFRSTISNIFKSKPKDVLYDTKYLQLKQAKAPNGSPWVYGHRPNAKNVVVIAPIIHNEHGDSIIFLETRRPPLEAENKAETCIELPAGLVGDENKNETIEQALEKELLEETGYKADKIEIVAKKVSSSSGSSSETATIAIADINKDEQIQKPVTDGGIILGLHKIEFSNVKDWLDEQEEKGKAISAQALSALYYVLTR